MSLLNKSQRKSSQKKRKHNDDESFDHNLELSIDASFRTQSYLGEPRGHIDLFGEIIPPNACSSKTEPKNKSVKKTAVPKKRKLFHEDSLIDTPVIKPKRIFIPTPRMLRVMASVMAESRKELYELMNRDSSNVSITSTDSLNVSGIQHLPESPITPIRNQPKINHAINDDDKKFQVLKGVVAFVDYKIDNEPNRCPFIASKLIDLGAKVEKTFNRKVTHVMFCDGYRSTYNKAVERNIPLVSARWMEYSRLAKKIQDPADYPPVGMEKYTKTPSKVVKISNRKSYLKFLDPSNIERDRQLKATCDSLMKKFNLVEKSVTITTTTTTT
ncbi:unnamed protein product [Aphis gossypii]|uniref:BRCT domain-containing protein n=1 Tax=Aphis gossypii TaxID=80765 RepID=A0A9P0NRA8_APHGO|nr:unnamed protein product [Aphis gossypii]